MISAEFSIKAANNYQRIILVPNVDCVDMYCQVGDNEQECLGSFNAEELDIIAGLCVLFNAQQDMLPPHETV